MALDAVRRLPAAVTLLASLALTGVGSGAETVCFEAEHANSADYPFAVESAEGASGGLALSAPQGAGDALAFRGRPGSALYRVPLSAAGSYTVWLRVKWRDGCGNSAIVRLGDAAPGEAVDEVFGRWHWVRAGRWKLPAGENLLRLQLREDGVAIDQVLLAAGSAAPGEGPAEARLVPGRPAGGALDWAFFSGPPAATGPEVPAELIPRHTAPEGSVAAQRLRTVVLRAGKPSALEAWIRNNPLGELRGKASLQTPAGVRVEPGAEQEFSVAAGAPLHRLAFGLSAGAELTRGTHELRIRAAGPDGAVREQKLLLIRPYQWLVSSVLPLRDDGGGRAARTAGAVESRLREGFPGGVEGLSWSVLAEEHVNDLGMVDLRAALGGREDVLAYAYTCVRCDKEAEYLLDVRHDDMIRVWVNGRQVFRESYDQTPAPLTRKLVPVRLAAGKNHLVVKLGQRQGYWEFGLGFLTAEGAPAPVRGEDTAGLVK